MEEGTKKLDSSISTSRDALEQSLAKVEETYEMFSSATTENPFPFSPALAASMDALRERIFVWSAIDTIFPIQPFIFLSAC